MNFYTLNSTKNLKNITTYKDFNYKNYLFSKIREWYTFCKPYHESNGTVYLNIYFILIMHQKVHCVVGIGLIIHKVGKFILLELELWYIKYIFGLWQCDILVSLMKYQFRVIMSNWENYDKMKKCDKSYGYILIKNVTPCLNTIHIIFLLLNVQHIITFEKSLANNSNCLLITNYLFLSHILKYNLSLLYERF